MIQFTDYLRTGVGMKKLMGLTGLGWSMFALIHMSGNLLIFVGPEAYNTYGHKIVTSGAVYVAEALLLTALLMHLVLGVLVTLHNRAARPVGYAVQAGGAKATSTSSRTMILSGSLLLAFIVLHLITFKYGEHYSVTYDGVGEIRDLYRLVEEKFQSPFYSGWYIFCLLLLGAHLKHGFAAAFQSLGVFPVNHPVLSKVSIAFGALVSLGFIAQPIYFLVKGGAL